MQSVVLCYSIIRKQHGSLDNYIKLMNESVPPPLPSGTRERGADHQKGPAPSSPGADPTYNLLADKIGGVPNIRKKDNLFQAAAIGVFLIVGAVVGLFVGEWPEGILLGSLAGLIAGTLISGAVLAVIGICRKS
jgi:hypothetical protein